MISARQYTPEDLWAIACRRKWIIIAPVILAAMVSVAITRSLPNRYRTDTLILVVPQRVPESYVRATVTSRIEDRLQSISQQILGRTRLEQIVRDLDLYPALRDHETMEEVVDTMRKDIDIDVVNGDSFRISYVGDQPKAVMQVTQRLASLFIDENLRDREQLADESYKFLDSQLDTARQELARYEHEMEEYRKKYSGQLPTQLDSNLRVVQNAQLQLQALSDARARDTDRRLIVERQIADLMATGGPAPGGVDREVEAAAAALDAAETQLRTLQVRLTAVHPDVIRQQATVAGLQQKLDQARAQAADGAHVEPVAVDAGDATRQNQLRELRAELENVNRQVARADQTENELHATIAQYQARADAAPTRETELTQLTRDYDTKRQAYLGMLVKQQDAQVAASLERWQAGQQFRVLDPARIPDKPFSPNRPRLDALGSLCGLAFGLGLVALLEWIDSTLRTEEDVRNALALPVLALVPLITPRADMLRARRTRRLLAVASTIIVIAAVVAWRLTS